jgi:DNA-binding transcriptional ArsR family regulator
MVKYSATLDSTFGALADPTRRAILASLMLGEASVSDLAGPHRMSLPAVMKHVRVLQNAGLVSQKKTGRTRFCQLSPAPLKQAEDWIAQYRRFWEGAFDSLERFLSQDPLPEKEKGKQKDKEKQSWPHRNRSRKTRSS